MKGLFSFFIVRCLAQLNIFFEAGRKQIELLQDIILDDKYAMNPALKLKRLGAKPDYPVFFISGSGGVQLELVRGRACAADKDLEGKEIWGGVGMLEFLAKAGRNCWLEHIALDEATGLDPPGIEVRPKKGKEGIGWFLPFQGVYSRLIRNLEVLGYTSENLKAVAYDWRLSFENLEKRDQTFSNLKLSIEDTVKATGKNVILTSLSLGGTFVLYFMKWVENAIGGNGGVGWVDRHIHAFVSVDSPFVGAPSAFEYFFTGMGTDFHQLGSFGTLLFGTDEERFQMFRSVDTLAATLPKGGNMIWGNGHTSPDMQLLGVNYHHFLTLEYANSVKHLTVEEAMTMLYSTLSTERSTRLSNTYSYGIAKTKKELDERRDIPKYWSNPLETTLPNAPNMTIYLLYGIDQPTARSFYHECDENAEEMGIPMCKLSAYTEAERGIFNGIQTIEGDATVPILSNGFFGVRGWTELGYLYNPHKVPVYVREYKPEQVDSPWYQKWKEPVGGPKNAKHVDILGNIDLIEDFLRIVTESSQVSLNKRNYQPTKGNRIFSNIEQVAKRVPFSVQM